MISVADFEDLKVGDQIETVPLMPTVCDDVIVLTCRETDHQGKLFDVTWLGIRIGLIGGAVHKGEVQWVA